MRVGPFVTVVRSGLDMQCNGRNRPQLVIARKRGPKKRMTVPKLTDFDPVITANGFLVFDCPACSGDNAHRIRVPLAPAVDAQNHSWQHTGDLSNLTLTPSVDGGCWHGNIVNGTMRQCGVSYE